MAFAVARTNEYLRVLSLYRRIVTTEEAERRAAAWQPYLARTGRQQLNPWQGYSLEEARLVGGAFLGLPVGLGKTLISFLLPTVMQAQQTLFVVKGRGLVDKTKHDFASISKDWVAPAGRVRYETLEWLSRDDAEGFLDALRPDLIVIDEADDCASLSNAAVRRLHLYIMHNRASVRVVVMTGTPGRKSVLDYWHLMLWCLGEQGMPLPADYQEARMWALGLGDHKQRRPKLGPLGLTVDEGRAWLKQRMAETPGVVFVDLDSCGAPLTVRLRLARECSLTDQYFMGLLEEGEIPGGIPAGDALAATLLKAQVGLGFYSFWDPPPPEEWREAWRELSRFSRARIEASTYTANPIHTLKQVIGRHRKNPIVVEWLRVKHLFDDLANRRTAWFSRAGLDSCHDWLGELDAPGIVWCGSVDFGTALARETGLTYYGREGKSANGQSILHAPPGRSFIASWQANKKGLNLQAWSRQLLTMPPQSAKWIEQIIGRSHRQGQHEHVIIDLLVTSGAALDSFETMLGEAAHARDTVTLTQKILRADIVRARPTINENNVCRWVQRLAA